MPKEQHAGCCNCSMWREACYSWPFFLVFQWEFEEDHCMLAAWSYVSTQAVWHSSLSPMVLIFNFWPVCGREKKCVGMHFWNTILLFSVYLFILICSYMSLMSSGLLRYWFICRSAQVVLCAWSLLRDMLWSVTGDYAWSSVLLRTVGI